MLLIINPLILMMELSDILVLIAEISKLYSTNLMYKKGGNSLLPVRRVSHWHPLVVLPSPSTVTSIEV